MNMADQSAPVGLSPGAAPPERPRFSYRAWRPLLAATLLALSLGAIPTDAAPKKPALSTPAVSNARTEAALDRVAESSSASVSNSPLPAGFWRGLTSAPGAPKSAAESKAKTSAKSVVAPKTKAIAPKTLGARLTKPELPPTQWIAAQPTGQDAETPVAAYWATSAAIKPRNGVVAQPSDAKIVNRTAAIAQTDDKGVAKVQGAKPRVVQADKPTPKHLPPALPARLDTMEKVISVSELTKLPPLSQPLPQHYQAAAVSVERLEQKLPAPAKNDNTRLAQDPNAPPMRQPDVPVTNSDRLPNQIEVAVSTFVVLMTTTDLQTVAVADPTIADVAVVNARAVLLNGKAPGVTSLVIVDGQKIRQYSVRVTPAPGSKPIDVAAAIGLPGVSVRPLKDALVLEGEVANSDEVRRALEIAGIYATKIINQLTIRGELSADAGAANQIQNLVNLPGVDVRVAGETVILTGTVETPSQIVDAERIAGATGKKVLNLLKLPTLTFEQARESMGIAEAPSQTPDTPFMGMGGALATPQPFTVKQVGDQIILNGVVPSQAQLDAALATAGRTGLTVINRAIVAEVASKEQGFLSNIAAAIGRPGIVVRGTAKRLVLEGVVPDTNAAVAAEQIARGFAAEVDNLLQTPNPALVNVDVTIVEINKTKLRALGTAFPGLFELNPGFTGGTNIGSIGAGEGGGGVNLGANFPVTLRALIDSGDAHLLSNPRTTVLSGRTATFQVGGQVPIPQSITVSATGTQIGVVFKDYGVLIDVVPNANLDGNVTMRVRTEVSAIDNVTGPIPLGQGVQVPSFTRRSAVTEVTVQPGGTVTLAGLIQHTNREFLRKIPILSKIPIFGALFTSKRYERGETDLAIFVTPRVLPNPLKPGTTAPSSVVAAGNTTNVGTILGNPGINSFSNGNAIIASPVGGGQ